MKIGIFTAFADAHLKVIDACADLGVDYEIVDILSSNWISNVQNSDCDGFFCSSTCMSQEKKSILDERYYFVSQIIKRPIYPDFLGLYIHENKRNMAAWLEINNFPHVKTRVFTSKNEALDYLTNAVYPLVIKANLGSASSKVRIIKTKSQAKRFAKKVFPINKWGLPLLNRGKVYWSKIKFFKIPDIASAQRDYLLVQDYKEILHEWRIIKIGNSYFGHQKLLEGLYASGSGKVGWVDPPKELLLLARDVCEKGGFLCMDVDIFENKQGEFFINELQASFGSYLNSQMFIDNKPGRYLYKDGEFIFEEGYFNSFGSNKLKVEHFVKLLSEEN